MGDILGNVLPLMALNRQPGAAIDWHIEQSFTLGIIELFMQDKH